MPGLAGIISRRPPDECQRTVAVMLRSMTHETFHASGTHAVPELGIYAGWVEHAEAAGTGRVFWNETKDVALVFSGEAFVPASARAELAQRGHAVGAGPLDWLVHQYEELGEDFFAALNGLFSGLLIDQRHKRAFLFNDRYGIQRLYWCETAEATYFATEAKALLAVRPELRAFDTVGLGQFLSYGSTLDWNTLFRGVKFAPGASLWRIEDARCKRGSYFSPTEWERQAPLGAAEFQEAFNTTFRRVGPHYFESGARAGIALTGGLDTRMLMACLPDADPRPVTYTYAGAHGETLDAKTAAAVAGACGLEHRLLRIGPDFFAGFGGLVERTVRISDGCFGALGAHEIHLNSLARPLSPLRLTGVFGSEVLRGVSTFKPVQLSPELFAADVPRQDTVARSAEWARLHPVTFAAFREIPWNIFGSLAACRSQVTFRTPFLDNEVVALAYRAPLAARRTPETAVQFVRQAAPKLAAIPTDRGLLGSSGAVGRAFRRGLAEFTFKLDYYHNEGMPDSLTRGEPLFHAVNGVLPLFGHHKFLHYRRWFRRELADHLRALTVDPKGGLFDRREVVRMVDEHVSGRRNRIADIGAVLTLNAIERTLLRA